VTEDKGGPDSRRRRSIRKSKGDDFSRAPEGRDVLPVTKRPEEKDLMGTMARYIANNGLLMGKYKRKEKRHRYSFCVLRGKGEGRPKKRKIREREVVLRTVEESEESIKMEMDRRHGRG